MSMNPPSKTLPISDLTPYQLSRIYAQGWIAGARSELDIDDAEAIASLNPCKTDTERQKWLEGFNAALARRVLKRTAD